jgi:hypothetical protein
MSKEEINQIKNKIKLWCNLHGISMGNRGISKSGNTGFVYREGCLKCLQKNGGKCLGEAKLKTNGLAFVLDTKNMRLYQNIKIKTINEWSGKNKNLWCAEWVKYV